MRRRASVGLALVTLALVGTAQAQPRDADGGEPPSALALWGSGPDDVWAVGRGGAAWRWNGAQWSRVALPSRGNFQSIWGRAADDIWIGGTQTTADQATVLHWDGRAWSDAHFPRGPVELVGGSDGGGVWVATYDGSVWSWDGSVWRGRVTAECRLPPCPRNATCGGGCMWARFHTAAGGLLIHPPPWSGFWDGRKLVRGRTPPPPIDRAFGGTRATRLLLESGPPSDRLSWSEVRRWDGRRWTALGKRRGSPWRPRGLDQEVAVRALWGATDDDVWAVGPKGTVIHWNGSAWRAFTVDTRADLTYLWGAAANDIWASGGPHPVNAHSAQAGPAVMLHWDGTRWAKVDVPGADAGK